MNRDNNGVWSRVRLVEPSISRLQQSLGFARGQLKQAERLVSIKPDDAFCKANLGLAKGVVEYLENQIKTRG